MAKMIAPELSLSAYDQGVLRPMSTVLAYLKRKRDLLEAKRTTRLIDSMRIVGHMARGDKQMVHEYFQRYTQIDLAHYTHAVQKVTCAHVQLLMQRVAETERS